MKQVILYFIVLMTFPICSNAQQHLFVEKGKTWHFIYFAPNHYLTDEHSFDSPLFEYDYAFKSEAEDMIVGKSYTKMYENDEVHGYYREESGKIYSYNADLQQEKLEYDFSLGFGDIFSTDLLGVDVKYEVEGTGSIKVNGNDYKTQTLQLLPSEEFGNWDVQTTWIEGIGNPDNPGSLNVPAVGGGRYILTYVTNELTGEYFPLSFTDRHLRGQQLVLGNEVDGDEEMLKFELLKDTLHVYGTMMTGCAPNQYIYCRDDKDGVITLDIVEMQPCSACRTLHEIDLYFSGFDADDYHIGDIDGPTLKRKSGDAADISSIHHNRPDTMDNIFSIMGIRLNTSRKGLNLINGKKVLIR
ncbi:MAG: hypothetical protein MJY81_08735 [Bacteroidaceae bacterium]|nr:hypothetical protein [Bacteroidaceae bacterium]